MRLLVAIFFIFLPFRSIMAQNGFDFCKTEICRSIMRNIERVRTLELEKNDALIELEEKKIELENLYVQINNQSALDDELSFLKAEKYYLDKEIVNKNREIADLVNRQNSLINRVKDLEDKYKEEVQRNTRLQKEIEELYSDLKLKEKLLTISNDNIARFLYLNSYISQYSLGYKKGNDIVYAKTLNSAGEPSAIRVGRGKKLDFFEMKGQLAIIDGDTPLDPQIIEGYILIYSGGVLKDTLFSSLIREHENFLPGIRSYSITTSNTTLSNSIYEDDDIMIAFMEKNVYNNLRLTEISDFVEAKSKGLFLIDSNKPTPFDYYSNTHKASINSSDIYTVSGDGYRLEFFDEGRVDNDIVTVYFNREQIFSRLILPPEDSRESISNMELREGDNLLSFEIVSEGSSPPCTIEYALKSQDGKVISSGKLYGKKDTPNPTILIRKIF